MTIGKPEIKVILGLIGTKPDQDQDNSCYLRKFYDLLTIPGTEVTNLIFPKDDMAWLSWKYSEENMAAWKNINVAVAA